MRGFFFAGRAARHQPASLLRARLKFATVQRDIEPKFLQIGSHNSERFCSNYYARRLKMRAFAIAAIITSLAVPALAQGDPAKAEANKAEERTALPAPMFKACDRTQGSVVWANARLATGRRLSHHQMEFAVG